MIKYNVPKNSTLLIAVDSESFEVKNIKDTYHAPLHRIFEIPEDGEFGEETVNKGDYLLMVWSYQVDREFYIVVKQGTDLHRFYSEIRDAENGESAQPKHCDCSNVKQG